MKKPNTFLIAVLCAVFCFALCRSAQSSAKKTIQASSFLNNLSVQYGLIKEGAVLLDERFIALTSLPPSYFVIIKDEENNHYNVNYLDLDGFIEKRFIEIVDYEPKTKFASAYFTANNDTHPVNIRSLPNGSAPKISYVPDKDKAFLYGSVQGEELIPMAGSTWYYIRYNDGTNRYGYVYGPQGTAEQIKPNVIEKIIPNNPDEDKDPAPLPPNNNNFEWLYVLLLCVPAIIIIFALFKGQKTSHQDEY